MFNPNTAFKMLKVSGIKVRFDSESRELVILNDDGEKRHSFDEIEKLVNGE